MALLDMLTAGEIRDLNAMFLSDGFSIFFKLLRENFQNVSENTLLQAADPEFDIRDLNMLRGRAFTLSEIEEFKTEVVNAVNEENNKVFTRETHTHPWIAEGTGSLYEGGKSYFINPHGGV